MFIFFKFNLKNNNNTEELMNFWARGEIARVQIVPSESEVLCLKISAIVKTRSRSDLTLDSKSLFLLYLKSYYRKYSFLANKVYNEFTLWPDPSWMVIWLIKPIYKIWNLFNWFLVRIVKIKLLLKLKEKMVCYNG